MITRDDLRTVSALADLDDDALAWLVAHMEELRLDTGEVLNEVGAPADWLVVVLEGRIRVTRDAQGREQVTFHFDAGDIGGMLPHSRMTRLTVASHAAEPTRVGRLHKRHFPEMLRRIPVLDDRLAHVMIDRNRAWSRIELQQEKLASLGTMAAGLAHELNNPASAARRAAQNLCDTLQAFDRHASSMLSKVMFKALPASGDPFQPVYDVLGSEPPRLDPVTRGEREDALSDWLEERGVEEPWDIAAILVSVGFTPAFMAAFTEQLVDAHVTDFLNWLPRDIEMRLLASELAESTRRISDLVSAMKSYSYMDRGQAMQAVDLHAGIDDTLVVIGHKLRNRSIEIVKDYGDLPKVPAFGSELNQVWTHLLDNAIAAVPERGGRIVIKTCFDAPAHHVQVDVIDNGSGILPDILDRIFDPFFTTRNDGEGNGLGLDITRRIVTVRHNGTIHATSMPGETRFQVRLPVAAA